MKKQTNDPLFGGKMEIKNLPPMYKATINLGLSGLSYTILKLISIYTGIQILQIIGLILGLFFFLAAGYFFIIRIYGEKAFNEFLTGEKKDEDNND